MHFGNWKIESETNWLCRVQKVLSRKAAEMVNANSKVARNDWKQFTFSYCKLDKWTAKEASTKIDLMRRNAFRISGLDVVIVADKNHVERWKDFKDETKLDFQSFYTNVNRLDLLVPTNR